MGKGLIMDSTDKVYLVSADHVSPNYRFQDSETRVRIYEDGTAFATHPKLGCGKTYSSAADAICGLFQDHACFMIKYREKAK
jgi:hypothetical protein